MMNESLGEVFQWGGLSGGWGEDERRQRIKHPRAEHCLVWAPTGVGERTGSASVSIRKDPRGETRREPQLSQKTSFWQS